MWKHLLSESYLTWLYLHHFHRDSPFDVPFYLFGVSSWDMLDSTITTQSFNMVSPIGALLEGLALIAVGLFSEDKGLYIVTAEVCTFIQLSARESCIFIIHSCVISWQVKFRLSVVSFLGKAMTLLQNVPQKVV